MTKPSIISKADDLLLRSAYAGANADARAALEGGANVNAVDEHTGLSALHLAIGTNNAPLARTLVEEFSAAFFADSRGRLPSLIAAECAVDDTLSDYVVQAEARFLEQERSA